MDKRYRLVYGETHEDVKIADDVDRCYLHGFQVDRLNEYDEKTNVMESKLNELGFKLIFFYEKWDMDKGFESFITEDPGPNDKGEWKVISVSDYEKLKEKANYGEKNGD